jgi:hypothetical protein
MTETYQSKWNQFLNEEKQFEFPFEELKVLLMDNGGDEEIVRTYMDSLKRDMESNMDDYLDFTTDDFIEDFENYVADKMGS